MIKKNFDMYVLEEEQKDYTSRTIDKKQGKKQTASKDTTNTNRKYCIKDNYAIDAYDAIDKDIKYGVNNLSDTLQKQDAEGVKKYVGEVHDGFTRMVDWQDKYKISSPYIHDNNDQNVLENNKKIEDGIKNFDELLRQIEENRFSNYVPKAHVPIPPLPKSYNTNSKSTLDGVVDSIKDIGIAFLYNLMKPFFERFD